MWKDVVEHLHAEQLGDVTVQAAAPVCAAGRTHALCCSGGLALLTFGAFWTASYLAHWTQDWQGTAPARASAQNHNILKEQRKETQQSNDAKLSNTSTGCSDTRFTACMAGGASRCPSGGNSLCMG